MSNFALIIDSIGNCESFYVKNSKAYKFKDNNPMFGDNKSNPYHIESSGGLLQIQLLLFATSTKKRPHIAIDNIKFFNTKNIKVNEPELTVDIEDDFY